MSADGLSTDAVALTDAEVDAIRDVVFPAHYGDPDLESVVYAVEDIVAARVAALVDRRNTPGQDADA